MKVNIIKDSNSFISQCKFVNLQLEKVNRRKCKITHRGSEYLVLQIFLKPNVTVHILKNELEKTEIKDFLLPVSFICVKKTCAYLLLKISSSDVDVDFDLVSLNSEQKINLLISVIRIVLSFQTTNFELDTNTTPPPTNFEFYEGCVFRKKRKNEIMIIPNISEVEANRSIVSIKESSNMIYSIMNRIIFNNNNFTQETCSKYTTEVRRESEEFDTYLWEDLFKIFSDVLDEEGFINPMSFYNIIGNFIEDKSTILGFSMNRYADKKTTELNDLKLSSSILMSDINAVDLEQKQKQKEEEEEEEQQIEIAKWKKILPFGTFLKISKPVTLLFVVYGCDNNEDYECTKKSGMDSFMCDSLKKPQYQSPEPQTTYTKITYNKRIIQNNFTLIDFDFESIKNFLCLSNDERTEFLRTFNISIIVFYGSLTKSKNVECLEKIVPLIMNLDILDLPYYFMIGSIATEIFGNHKQMYCELMKTSPEKVLTNTIQPFDNLFYNEKWQEAAFEIKEKLSLVLTNSCDSKKINFYLEKSHCLRVYPFPCIDFIENFIDITFVTVLLLVKGLMMSNFFDHCHLRKFDQLKKLDDVSFVPIEHRFWMSFRYCQVCGQTSMRLNKFKWINAPKKSKYGLFDGDQNAHERKYMCSKCFSKTSSVNLMTDLKKTCKVVDQIFVDSSTFCSVALCFTYSYSRKFKDAVVIAKHLIGIYSKNSDFENETIFRFFLCKVMKHSLQIKKASSLIEESLKLLLVFPRNTMFKIRYECLYIYERSLCRLIAGDLENALSCFKAHMSFCQNEFANQCLSIVPPEQAKKNPHRGLKILLSELNVKKGRKVKNFFGAGEMYIYISRYHFNLGLKSKGREFLLKATRCLKNLESHLHERTAMLEKKSKEEREGKIKGIKSNVEKLKVLIDIEKKRDDVYVVDNNHSRRVDIKLKLVQCYSMNFLAYILRQRGQRDDAMKQLEEIMEVVKYLQFNDVIKPNALQHMGVVLFEKGFVERSLKLLNVAMDELKNFPRLKERKEVEIRQSLAELYLGNGKINDAFDEIQKPLVHAEETTDQNFKCICWKIHGKILQKLGNHGKSIRVLNKSLEICVKFRLSVVDEVLQLIGINFYELQKMDNAMRCFEKALEIAEDNKNEFRVGDMKLSMGKIMIERGEYKNAKEFFNHSKRIGRKYSNYLLLGKSSEFLGVMYHQNAKTIAKQMGIEETLREKKEMELLERAYNKFTKSLNYYEILNSYESQMLVLSNQGRVCEKLGKNEKAEASYRKSISLFINYFSELKDFSHFLATANSKMIIFSRCINFYYNQQRDLNHMVQRLKRSRKPDTDRILATTKKLIKKRLYCLKIIEYVKNLVNRVSMTEKTDPASDPPPPPPPPPPSKLKIPLNMTSFNYYVFRNKIIRVFIQEGHIIFIDRKHVDVERMKKFLKTHEQAIVEHRENVLIDKVTGKLDVINPPSETTVNALLVEYKWIGELLFGGLPLGTKLPEKFVIFPHRFLFSLPFACLIVKEERFLIKDHTFMVSPSMILFVKQVNKYNDCVLDVPYAQRKQRLRGLFMGNPLGKKEVTKGLYSRELKHLFLEHNKKKQEQDRKSTILEASSFTRENVLKLLADNKFDFLHIVSHHCFEEPSNVFEDRFKFSGSLELSNAEFIHAKDIIEMDLSLMDFVFFNACNSARGRVNNLGILGFFQSFLRVGVKSVICCTSAVQNSFAFQVAKNFYDEFFWGNNLSKTECLRKSLLSIVKHKNAKNFSFLWGGYAIFGFDDAEFEKYTAGIGNNCFDELGLDLKFNFDIDIDNDNDGIIVNNPYEFDPLDLEEVEKVPKDGFLRKSTVGIVMKQLKKKEYYVKCFYEPKSNTIIEKTINEPTMQDNITRKNMYLMRKDLDSSSKKKWGRFSCDLSEDGDFFVVLNCKSIVNQDNHNVTVYLILEDDVRFYSIKGLQQSSDKVLISFRKRSQKEEKEDYNDQSLLSSTRNQKGDGGSLLDIDMWLFSSQMMKEEEEVIYSKINELRKIFSVEMEMMPFQVKNLYEEFVVKAFPGRKRVTLGYSQSTHLIVWMKSDGQRKQEIVMEHYKDRKYARFRNPEGRAKNLHLRETFRSGVSTQSRGSKLGKPKEIRLTTNSDQNEDDKNNVDGSPFELEAKYQEELVLLMT